MKKKAVQRQKEDEERGPVSSKPQTPVAANGSTNGVKTDSKSAD
jgi:hypothetical protein